MKITKFADIPKFTKDGHWECDYEPTYLLSTFDEWAAGSKCDVPLQLNPDFQRGHVWTEAQQIAWIEFFLRGGKTGRVIYLNHPGWQTDYKGDFVLVDGKQRLTALRRFFNNEIKAFGSFRKEFTDSPRFLQTMKVNINTLKTRAEVLQWYVQFNSGGTPHSDEEIARVKKLLEVELLLEAEKKPKK